MRIPLSLTLSPFVPHGERECSRASTRTLPLLHGFCGGEGRGEEERFKNIRVKYSVPHPCPSVVQHFCFPGIKSVASQSGVHMKNKPDIIREVRRLSATADHLDQDHAHDGVDRRGFLKCMAWAGTGMLWTVTGGVLGSKILSPPGALASESSPSPTPRDFSFVQISDSHIGFNKPANTDVTGTLKKAIAKINALPTAPDFILHTGDLSHLSEPAEFDALDQLLKSARTGQIFFVPGEHDVISDNGKEFRARYGKDARGNGWFSFDQRGV